mgnify:CR=1 FL=1
MKRTAIAAAAAALVLLVSGCNATKVSDLQSRGQLKPGSRPCGNFQISSACARCSGLVTTMSAGRRCANVPTSRAVPQADGCPVSENGLLPGSEIFPVSR